MTQGVFTDPQHRNHRATEKYRDVNEARRSDLTWCAYGPNDPRKRARAETRKGREGSEARESEIAPRQDSRARRGKVKGRLRVTSGEGVGEDKEGLEFVNNAVVLQRSRRREADWETRDKSNRIAVEDARGFSVLNVERHR
jgi:hypothetical protein